MTRLFILPIILMHAQLGDTNTKTRLHRVIQFCKSTLMHLYILIMAACRLKHCNLIFVLFYVHSGTVLSIQFPLLLAICTLIKLLYFAINMDLGQMNLD